MLLALGASRWEALHGTLQAGALAAVMPVLDQMSVMGLVAMPGLMAGQLLSGVSAPQVNFGQVTVFRAGSISIFMMHDLNGHQPGHWKIAPDVISKSQC